MDMMFADCVRVVIGGTRGHGAQSVPCACCGFPECPMMMQIRLPLLTAFLASCGLLADLLCCLPVEDLLDLSR